MPEAEKAKSWFDECRYGMFVHANIATVPAFAPVHEYADWYWAFLEPKPDVILHPTCPLPEVVTWHQEHFGDQPFDAFLPRLTFEHFDADAYAELLDAAGMRYLVHVTKHHDGFCWWDTACTDRNSMQHGPRRDIVAELARATRARGHVFGCYYSLLDWSHPAYPDQDAYVDAFMRPQIRELVERYQPALLWGDGHWGHPGGHWRADELLAEAKQLVPELVANDRFFASAPDFTTFEYDVPANPPDGRWELCRGLGYSFCVNRAERDEDHLRGRDIVAMLVETVAKGGNLLLNVGPNADGTLPGVQERALREAGEWIRTHAEAIHGSQRFDVAGDGQQWFTRAGGLVHAFDLSSAVEPTFAGIEGVVDVSTIDGDALPYVERGGALVIDARAIDRHPFGTRYCIELGQREHVVVDSGHVSALWTITRALAKAQAKDVIEVPAGHYSGAGEKFPLVVPAGVILRAAAGVPAHRVVIDAGGTHAVQLAGDGAAIEGVTVIGGAPGYMMLPPTCVTGSGNELVVRACHVEAILVSGGAGHVVEDNVVSTGKVWLMGTNGSTVRGNYQHGLRWGAGIELNGGAGHVVTDNECHEDLCAIRLTSTTGAEVMRNRYETRWFGIHLLDAQDTHLYRNAAWRTMRAVSIEGGARNVVEKQLAEHCDSGVLIERGAEQVRVSECWLHDCRIGMLIWEAPPAEIADNFISEPRDHAIVGDTWST